MTFSGVFNLQKWIQKCISDSSQVTKEKHPKLCRPHLPQLSSVFVIKQEERHLWERHKAGTLLTKKENSSLSYIMRYSVNCWDKSGTSWKVRFHVTSEIKLTKPIQIFEFDVIEIWGCFLLQRLSQTVFIWGIIIKIPGWLVHFGCLFFSQIKCL